MKKLAVGLALLGTVTAIGCGSATGGEHPIIEQHAREAREANLEAKVCAIPKAQAAALGHLEVWEATCE